MGESGCGKSTIGKLVVGLEEPTSGAINFEGKDLAKSSGREYRRERRNIQLMFQDSYASLDPRMRAGTLLREPLVIQGIGSKQEQLHTVSEMLDKVGLPRSAADRYPHEFSGGQRQRLGFARALMLNPQLIVADEPVSALDVSIQAQVLNMMKELQRDLGLTYLFISHDLGVVRYLSDQIGVMYLGKLVEVGPAEEVYLRPAHPYTRGLLDSAPVADPGSGEGQGHRGCDGRAAERYPPAVWLPLPDAVPAGAGHLRRRGAADAAVPRRGTPGGLPLPAAECARRCRQRLGRRGVSTETRYDSRTTGGRPATRRPPVACVRPCSARLTVPALAALTQQEIRHDG